MQFINLTPLPNLLLSLPLPNSPELSAKNRMISTLTGARKFQSFPRSLYPLNASSPQRLFRRRPFSRSAAPPESRPRKSRRRSATQHQVAQVGGACSEFEIIQGVTLTQGVGTRLRTLGADLGRLDAQLPGPPHPGAACKTKDMRSG